MIHLLPVKTSLAFLLALAMHSAALDITVPGGGTFRDCAQFRVVGAELQFMHASGTARVRYDKLSPALAEKYFGSERLAALRAQDQSAAEALATIRAVEQAAAEKAYRERNAEMERKAAAASAAIAAKTEAERLIAEGVARQAAADREWEAKKKAREAAENAPTDHYLAAFAVFRAKAKAEGDVLKQFGIPPPPEMSGLSPEEAAARDARLENYRAKNGFASPPQWSGRHRSAKSCAHRKA
jgi:hypothetical protein